MDQICIRLIMITITIGSTKIIISHMAMVTNKLTLDQRSSSATLAQQRGISSLFPRGTPSSQPHLSNIPIATSMVIIKPFHSISTPSINILIQWDPVYISTSYVVSQHSHIKICETLSHLSFPIVSSHTCSQSCWWPDHEWHCDYRSSSFSVAVYILFFLVCL